MEDELLAAVISLASGFAGAWFGSVLALGQFRKERGFDRQVGWYESAIQALHEMAQRIDIALTFQATPGTEPEHLAKVWRDVQRCHVTVDNLSLKSALYASADAQTAIGRIAEHVQDIANETEAFDPASLPAEAVQQAIEQIGALPQKLLAAATPLAKEARRHLALS